MKWYGTAKVLLPSCIFVETLIELRRVTVQNLRVLNCYEFCLNEEVLCSELMVYEGDCFKMRSTLYSFLLKKAEKLCVLQRVYAIMDTAGQPASRKRRLF